MTLKELSEQDHPYYGSGYYQEEYETFEEFFDSMNGMDVDLNLCYRFDVGEIEENKEYDCTLTIIHQRKGYCSEHYIKKFTEEDIPKLEKYLKPHQEVLTKVLAPFNSNIHNM